MYDLSNWKSLYSNTRKSIWNILLGGNICKFHYNARKSFFAIYNINTFIKKEIILILWAETTTKKSWLSTISRSGISDMNVIFLIMIHPG